LSTSGNQTRNCWIRSIKRLPCVPSCVADAGVGEVAAQQTVTVVEFELGAAGTPEPAPVGRRQGRPAAR
jgi:hypothetical protein